MIQRKWELQHNNNNTSTKNTVTNKKLDQRINLRRQHHNKLQLTLNGNITIHENVREYGYQFSKSTETQEIETVRIHSHNINNMPQYSSHLMINHRTLDESSFIAHKSSSSIPTIASLCAESQATLPISETIVPIISDLPLALNPVLNDSLFFVQFTPAGTMLRRWYLIQIDLASTKEINPDYLSNGEYWCVFLARHSSDKRNSNEFSRWWPE